MHDCTPRAAATRVVVRGAPAPRSRVRRCRLFFRRRCQSPPPPPATTTAADTTDTAAQQPQPMIFPAHHLSIITHTHAHTFYIQIYFTTHTFIIYNNMCVYKTTRYLSSSCQPLRHCGIPLTPPDRQRCCIIIFLSLAYYNTLYLLCIHFISSLLY